MESFIKGIITVKLSGNTPERFINICYANNIRIKNVERHGGEYFFEISPQDYFKIKKIVRKTASGTKIIKKKGLPFLIFRYRTHGCFLAGLVLACTLIYIISLFVWDISISGNNSVTDDVIIDRLKSDGIHHGIFINKISCDELEKDLRRDFDEFTWVSAEINGTRLIIYVKENDEDYIKVRENDESSLVAAKDGIISSIITRSGTPMVRCGDEVKTGDILVSGVINVKDDYGSVISRKNVCADADISICTEYEYEDRIKAKYEYKLFTGKKYKNYYIRLLDWSFYTGFNKKFERYDRIINDTQVRINNNFYLPVHFGTAVYSEYNKESEKYTDSEADNILNEHFEYFLGELEEKGVQIIQKDVKMYKNGYEYVYRGKVKVYEPAYIRSEISEAEYDIGDNNEYN